MLTSSSRRRREYLLISDFDQTLSHNDSAVVLSEILGISDFRQRVAGLSDIHLVQQGGELAYLLLHDPEFRCVRKEHLIEVGKRVRLKANVELLLRSLENLEGFHFCCHVLSSVPEEVIQSALAGIVPENHIHGTQFRYASDTGEIQYIVRAPAGYGKVAVLEDLRSRAGVGHDRLVYVGDGSSDVHVMLHVNRLDGLTIAVSENKPLNEIAKRTVLSDDALCVLVPILEEIAGYDPVRVRTVFESQGLVLGVGKNAYGFADDCSRTKDELEHHLSDIRRLATSHGLNAEERETAARAERFAIGLLREHDASGHDGERCPFATRI